MDAATIVGTVGFAVMSGLLVFLVLFFARVLLRNQWLAAVVPAGFLAAGSLTNFPQPAVIFVITFVLGAVVSVALMRLGLLVAVTALFAILVVANCLPTSNFTAWYGQGAFLSVLVLVALAVWAFRTSLGDQKLFSSPQD
jgi:hypothetical protein